MRLGVPTEYFQPGMDAEIEAAVRAALDELARAGAKIVPVSLPHTKYAIATYYLICTAEASSNLARYDGVKYGHRTAEARSLEELYTKTRGEGFGAEPKRRIMLGAYVLRAGYYEAYYGKALRARRKIADDFSAAFSACDAIVTPTSPVPAFKFGERIGDPLQMYLADILTVAPNLAGHPGAVAALRLHQVRAADRSADHRPARWAKRSASASAAPTSRAPTGTSASRRRPPDGDGLGEWSSGWRCTSSSPRGRRSSPGRRRRSARSRTRRPIRSAWGCRGRCRF